MGVEHEKSFITHTLVSVAAYTNDGGDHKAMISDKTVCMRAVQGELGQYKHYDVHSLYGWSQTVPTLE